MFDRLKSLLGSSGGPRSAKREVDTHELRGVPDIPRVSSEDNRWHVPLLGVHVVTQNVTATSQNPLAAMNAVSFGQDDGTKFIGQVPPSERTIEANLKYRTDDRLVEGALFLPEAMEHKWALYFHRGKVLAVRSWLRQVIATATLEQDRGEVLLTSIRGVFSDDEEPADLTLRIFDFLIRSHALDLEFPCPLPARFETAPKRAALWCFSLFGNKAQFATTNEVVTEPPDRPLRTYSLLHMSAARGDIRRMSELLSHGVSPDLADRDGQPPLHWALASEGLEASNLLLDHGAQIDSRDPEGATMLMQVVQLGKLPQATHLLLRKADPNARDSRGFTALHRAAYLGNAEMTEVLLHFGADATLEADGLTALSHAIMQGHQKVAGLLSSHLSG